jgi:hypothetical protein
MAEEEEEELGDEEILLARMDAGLYTLQQCALIVGQLWMAGDAGVRKRVLVLLHQKGQALAAVREALREYRANLGDDGGWQGEGFCLHFCIFASGDVGCWGRTRPAWAAKVGGRGHPLFPFCGFVPAGVGCLRKGWPD